MYTTEYCPMKIQQEPTLSILHLYIIYSLAGMMNVEISFWNQLILSIWKKSKETYQINKNKYSKPLDYPSGI